MSRIVKSPFELKPLEKIPFGRRIVNGLKNNLDRHIFIDAATERKYTGRQVLQAATNLATILREDYGLETGDVVCISAPSCDLTAILMVSVVLAGGSYIGVGDTAPYRELSGVIDDIKAKILVCGDPNLETAIEVRAKSNCLKQLLVLHAPSGGNDSTLAPSCGQNGIHAPSGGENCINTPSGGKNVTEPASIKNVPNLTPYLFSEPIESKTGLKIPVERGPEDVLIFMLSSGSTGKPKMIQHTDNSLSWMVTFGGEFGGTKVFQIGSGDVYMGYALNHMSGTMMLFRACATGATMITKHEHDYNNENILQYVQKYRPNRVMWLPCDLRFLVNTELVKKYDLSSIISVFYGGSPTPKELYEKVVSKFNWVLTEGYGSSEIGMITCQFHGNIESDPSSVGHLAPGVEVQVINRDTLEPLGPGQVGEICARSPVLMKGYYDNAEANASSFLADGFFRMGDMGYYDEKGQLFLIGRYKEIMLIDAEVISPIELENVLLMHDAVFEAAVVGIPDDLHGEIPRGFATLKPGFSRENVSEKELVDFVNARVNPYKQMRGGIFIVDEFPRTNIGKIRKAELKNLVPSRA